jgi:hypothetical protein
VKQPPLQQAADSNINGDVTGTTLTSPRKYISHSDHYDSLLKSLSPMHKENKLNSNSARQFDAKQYNHSNSEQKAALEVSIAKLWQELLGLPSVGLEDNFFEMGGTSLLQCCSQN